MDENKREDANIIVYRAPDGGSAVKLLARDGSVWRSPKQIADLFVASTPNISIHIRNILETDELEHDSVVKFF